MKNVTFVDDDPDIQEIFSLVFANADFKLNQLTEGYALLENEGDTADVIILDKQLPDIDGIEVCQRLKQEEETKDIPIIMLSANHDIKALAKEAGAEESIEKPFSIKKLKVLIDKYIK
ncbi:MAG TPA: response regulator [Chitinophagaceae bacterium]|nr:response regulator [Chitinophagaceae bacterium]